MIGNSFCLGLEQETNKRNLLLSRHIDLPGQKNAFILVERNYLCIKMEK
jgi:hypothetical protein